MPVTCTLILVGVVSLVSEILLLSKTVKFPFLTMDYSPWSSKNSIGWNRLKKFMQVWIDVTCMHINFGGCGLFGFGDTATFKNGQISPWTIVHGHQKIQLIGIGSKNSCRYGLMSSVCTSILVGVTSPVLEILLLSKTVKFPFQNRPKKFMQVGIDVKFMHTNFGGRDLSSFGDIATFQKRPIFPFGANNLINRNRPKKFMQVRINVKFMHTNFGRRDLSSFGDIATFKNGQISLLTHGL